MLTCQRNFTITFIYEPATQFARPPRYRSLQYRSCRQCSTMSLGLSAISVTLSALFFLVTGQHDWYWLFPIALKLLGSTSNALITRAHLL